MLPESLTKQGRTNPGMILPKGGMNSFLLPEALSDEQYAVGYNVTCRGGLIRCRPGYKEIRPYPGTKGQGFHIFSPTVGKDQMLVSTDGDIYFSSVPFLAPNRITNIKFNPNSEFVNFVTCTQTNKNVPHVPIGSDDGNVTVEPTNPKQIVIMQDGSNRAAYFDGYFGAHATADITLVNPNQYKLEANIPIGQHILWAIDRLWVCQDNLLYIGDIGNPLSFGETNFAGEGGYFVLPGIITGIARTTDGNGVVVFTDSTTTFFNAAAMRTTPRADWKTDIKNLQQIIFPETGCLAHRSIIHHFGQIWWYSNYGTLNYDSARQGNVTSNLPKLDNEMNRSASNLSPTLFRIAAGKFDNFLLMSVPSGDLYNRHTWVMEGDISDTLNAASNPVWAGIWLGTRPLQWFTKVINGESKCYFLSKDYDNVIRVWEAFQPDYTDNGCPITWSIETKAFTGGDLELKKFIYAKIFAAEIAGILQLHVSYAKCDRGPFREIYNKRTVAGEGYIGFDDIMPTTMLFSALPQTRIRTTQAVDDTDVIVSGDNNIESKLPSNQSYGFQLYIMGTGKGAIKAVQIVIDPVVESGDGTAKNDTIEGGENESVDDVPFVREDGTGFIGKANELYEGHTSPVFSASSTKTVTCPGGYIPMTVTRTVIANSNVSQIQAQINADTAALAAANAALNCVPIGMDE